MITLAAFTLAGKFGATAAVFLNLAWILAVSADFGERGWRRKKRAALGWLSLGLATVFAITGIALAP